MRKVSKLLVLFFILTLSLVFLLSNELEVYASGATDLFFSEYIEGSSNNKAIEIYNGTGSDLDLSEYKVELYANGSTNVTSTHTFSENTILKSGEVYVLYNNQSSAGLIERVGANSSKSDVANFNGDDALAIRKVNGNVLIDVIGQIGTDPGNAWNWDGGSTVDKTLIRKSEVFSGKVTLVGGKPTWDNTEWLVYDRDTFTHLGSHTMTPPTPKYSIIFDSNGGSGTMASLTGEVGQDVVIPSASFTRQGYEFTGWNTQADGNGIDFELGNYTITANNVTLFAQWKQLEYDVVLMDSDEIYFSGKIKHGENINVINPSKPSYAFLGWATEDGIFFDLDTPITEDLTLFAQWEIVYGYVDVLLTVMPGSMENKIESVVLVALGDTIEFNFENQEGFEFAYFIVNGKIMNNTPVDFKFIVTSGMHIIAVLKPENHVAITFVDSDGTFIETQFIDTLEDSQIAEPDISHIIKKANYDFSENKWKSENGILTEDTIAVKDEVYVLQYDLIDDTNYTVIVTGGIANKELYKYSEFATITADDIATFDYWVDSEDNIVSYKPVLTVSVLNDLELIAVYDDEVDQETIVSVNQVNIRTDFDSFVGRFELYNDETLVEFGFLLSKVTETDSENFNHEKAETRVRLDIYQPLTKEFLSSFKTSNGYVSFRAYLITKVNDTIEYRYSNIIHTDIVAPVISGVDTDIQLNIGDDEPNWLDGVTAIDDIDGIVEISVDISNVNLNVEGEYFITYTAVDKAGNKSQIQRNVMVLAVQNHTATISTSGSYTSGISDGVVPAERIIITNDGAATITVSFKSNSSTNTIFNNSAGEIRLYPQSNNGGQLTISIEGEFEIIKVVVNTSQNPSNGLLIDGDNYTGSSVEVDFTTPVDSFVIKNGNSATTGSGNQLRITGIIVYYKSK